MLILSPSSLLLCPILLFEAAENPYYFTTVHSHPEILLVFHKTFGTLTVSSSTCHVPLSHPKTPKQSHCQGSQRPCFSWTAGKSLGAVRARNQSALCRFLVTRETGFQHHWRQSRAQERLGALTETILQPNKLIAKFSKPLGAGMFANSP